VFETDEQSQVVAKYLDDRFGLGLFPRDQEGVQSILWRHIESEVEGFTFKLNDIHWTEFVPKREHWAYVRHKERRFGRGCLDAWRHDKDHLLAGLARSLLPFEEMLVSRPFLLDDRPLFVDFDLHGMLANFLHTGHYELPAEHLRLQQWHARMSRITFCRTT
jgi:glutathione S-transferase